MSYYKNWKTVNSNIYYTESDNPILKKDEHHAEIIDITDGLVVEEQTQIIPNYKLNDHEILKQNDIMCAFSNIGKNKNINLNKKHI